MSKLPPIFRKPAAGYTATVAGTLAGGTLTAGGMELVGATLYGVGVGFAAQFTKDVAVGVADRGREWTSARYEVVRKIRSDTEKLGALGDPLTLRAAFQAVRADLWRRDRLGKRLHSPVKGDLGFLSPAPPAVSSAAYAGVFRREVVQALRAAVWHRGPIRVGHIRQRVTLTAVFRIINDACRHDVAFPVDVFEIDAGAHHGPDQVRCLQGTSPPDIAELGDADWCLGRGLGSNIYRWFAPLLFKSQVLVSRGRASASKDRQVVYAEGTSAEHELRLGSERLRRLRAASRSIVERPIAIGSINDHLRELEPWQAILAWDSTAFAAGIARGTQVVRTGGIWCANSLYIREDHMAAASAPFRAAVFEAIVAGWNVCRLRPLYAAMTVLGDSDEVRRFASATRAG